MSDRRSARALLIAAEKPGRPISALVSNSCKAACSLVVSSLVKPLVLRASFLRSFRIAAAGSAIPVSWLPFLLTGLNEFRKKFAFSTPLNKMSDRLSNHVLPAATTSASSTSVTTSPSSTMVVSSSLVSAFPASVDPGVLSDPTAGFPPGSPVVDVVPLSSFVFSSVWKIARSFPKTSFKADSTAADPRG